MVKGPARNAQFYFITEFVIPKYNYRSFYDALNTGRQLWKTLPEEEKAKWKAKEKQWKAYMRGPAGDKYRKTSDGYNLQQHKDDESAAKENDRMTRQTALDYVKDRREALEQPFYFLSFEYALLDDYGKYYPCEVALVKYTLIRGIEQYLHYFLKPADYPIGTKATAKKHSEDRHKIPYLGFEKATDGYSAVYAHIRDILTNTHAANTQGASGGFPPIYCMPDDVPMVRKCLEDLCDRALIRESERPQHIASATLLLMKLFGENVCGEGKAMEILGSSAFDHEKGVACDWHYEQECVNCALATSRKIAFALSDSLKTTYDLQITQNHLPTLSANPYSSSTAVPFEASGQGWGAGSSGFYSEWDSVVSGRQPKKGASNESVVSGLSQLSISSAGRGRATKPSYNYAQRQTIPEDDDDGWTTVSASSKKPTSKRSTATWDDSDDEAKGYNKPNNYGQNGLGSTNRDYDWDDDWEGGSIASTTVRSSAANPYARTSSSTGRGRGNPYY